MVSVGLILRFMHVLVRLHFVLVQTISLINLKLSVSINVEISYAFYPCDNSYDEPLLSHRPYFSYGLERFICSRSDDGGDNVLFSVRLSVVSQLLRHSHCMSVHSAAAVQLILCRSR